MQINDVVVKEKQNRIITGWASVDMVDLEKEIVDLDELEKQFYNFMDRGGTLIDSHSNRPVGKLINFERREKQTKNGPKDGIFVTAKIFDGYKTDDEVWDKIKSGKYTGFSFGGASHDKEYEDTPGGPVKRLIDLEAHELSVVEAPANPEALFESVNMLAKSANKGKIFLVKGDPTSLKELVGKPFAGYANFDDCVKQNSDKNDPEGYCATVMRDTEEKAEPKRDGSGQGTRENRGRADCDPPEDRNARKHASSDASRLADDYNIGEGTMSEKDLKKQEEEDKKPIPKKPEDEKKPEEDTSKSEEEDTETKSIEDRVASLEKAIGKLDETLKAISTSEEQGNTMSASNNQQVKLPKDPSTEDKPIGDGKDDAGSSEGKSEVMEKMEQITKRLDALVEQKVVKKTSTPRAYDSESSLFQKAESPAMSILKRMDEGKNVNWAQINDARKSDEKAQLSEMMGG